jgi:hypothetical protein
MKRNLWIQNSNTAGTLFSKITVENVQAPFNIYYILFVCSINIRLSSAARVKLFCVFNASIEGLSRRPFLKRPTHSTTVKFETTMHVKWMPAIGPGSQVSIPLSHLRKRECSGLMWPLLRDIFWIRAKLEIKSKLNSFDTDGKIVISDKSSSRT